jgi:Family of unknown function (DUF6130)
MQQQNLKNTSHKVFDPVKNNLTSTIIMQSSNTELGESVFPSAREMRGTAAVVQLDTEPPSKLFVDPPLPGPLSFGRVVIQYRTENLRIVPVYGEGALDVSPRIGHLHLTVDNASWHWLDASGEAITLNGFTPGMHSILIELADPTHKIIDRKTIEFIIP